MVEIRTATVADFRAYWKRDVPAEWTCWLGQIAEQDGKPVGMAGVYWNSWGIAVGFFDKRGPIPAITAHRASRHFLDVLAKAGERCVWAGCDEAVPIAAKWLRSLGFLRDGRDVNGQILWRLSLA